MTSDWQTHALSRKLDMPSSAKELTRQLRSSLQLASRQGKLATPPREILELVQMPALPAGLASQLKSAEGAHCIVGGEKNFKRDPNRRHFARSDGAWFDFSIVVREAAAEPLELLAYDFEIRFPSGVGGVPFVRFDLNPPDHGNQKRELRSHLHPGANDLLVPAPMLSPIELLSHLVDGMTIVSGRKTRALTGFERDWYRDTAAALASEPE